MNKLFLITIMTFGFCCFAQANEQENHLENFALKHRLEWLNWGAYHNINESKINPDNLVLDSVNTNFQSELRADLEIKYKNQTKFVIRPLIELQYQQIKSGEQNSQSTQTEQNLFLTEAYLENWLNDEMNLSFGLQNYQWGPGELFSPSNPFFHFNNQQKSLFNRDKGRVLLRANYTYRQNISFVLISEFIEARHSVFDETKNDSFWIADRKFEQLNLLKMEWLSENDANNYVGVTLGQQEAQKKMLGFYNSFVVNEETLLYSDMKFSEGTISYYPKEITLGVLPQFDVLSVDENRTDQIQTLGLIGLRYQSDWDYRLEYLYNSAGYRTNEFQRALTASSSVNPYYLLNLNRFSKSGLELIGRHYLYLSLRIPDLGVKKDSSFYFRSLYSLQDKSQSNQLSYEKFLNDYLVANGEFVLNSGSQNSELTLFDKTMVALGLKAYF